MAKEQLAVIEMVTNMILGKTEGISKVDFVPQKTRCPEPENVMHMHDKVPVIQDQDIEKTKNQQQIFPRKTPESQGIGSDHLRYLIQELADSPNTDMPDSFSVWRKVCLTDHISMTQHRNGNRTSDR